MQPEFVFVEPYSVLDEVSVRLRSYHEAGLIDPALMSKQLHKALADIGLDAPASKLETYLTLDMCKSRLPQNCYTLEQVWWLNPAASCPIRCQQINPYPSHGQLYADTYNHGRPGDQPLYPIELYPHHKHTYRRQHQQLYTNQTKGWLYIQYTGTLSTDNLPMIPEDALLEDYFVKKLVYEQIKDLYLNGEVANLDRILQLVNQEYLLALQSAQQYIKLPSFATLVAYQQTKPRSFTHGIKTNSYHY